MFYQWVVLHFSGWIFDESDVFTVRNDWKANQTCLRYGIIGKRIRRVYGTESLESESDVCTVRNDRKANQTCVRYGMIGKRT